MSLPSQTVLPRCDWCLKPSTSIVVGCFNNHGLVRSFLCPPCAEFMSSEEILIKYPDEETIMKIVLKNIKKNIEIWQKDCDEVRGKKD